MTTATATSRKTANVIWVENKPELVTGWVKAIKKHTEQAIEIEIVKNSTDLEKAIDDECVSSFVFDIKLDERPDGITLAKRIRKKNKIVPVRFVSSYLDEYLKRILEVENLNGFHDRELADEKFTDFWQGLAEDTYSYQTYRANNVAKITWDEFMRSPKQDEIVYSHSRLFTRLARETMENNDWSWAAFSGERAVCGSKSMSEFPSFEEKKNLTDKHGGFAFVYSQPFVSEEGGENGMLLNYYPKIQIKIEDKETLADFDTGTNQTLTSDSLLTAEPGSIPHLSKHLGRPFEYVINQRSMSFHSHGESDDFVGPVKMPVAIVKDWNGKDSPWKLINPEREALIGRDIFAVDKIVIQLISTSELDVSTNIAKHEK